MNRASIACTLSVILLAAACENSGANYTPVVDGPKGPAFDADLADCQALAASTAGLDERTAGAAATGAVIGGASSAIWNGNSNDIGRSAAIGALGGLTTAEVRKVNEREAIVKRCMSGRGYNVIG